MTVRTERLPEIPGYTPVQYKLDGGFEIRPSNRIKVDATASEVLEEVLRCNTRIKRVSYITYECGVSGADFEINGQQEPRWLARSLITKNNLKLLSDVVIDERMQHISGEKHDKWFKHCISGRGLAITSKIKLPSGVIAHIPMMDFVCEPEFDEELALKAIGGVPGFLLETDYSFHFWGINIMSEDGWRSFMIRCRELDKSVNFAEMFDPSFIDFSLQRGFSALRLFNCPPSKDKEYEPKVVKINNY